VQAGSKAKAATNVQLMRQRRYAPDGATAMQDKRTHLRQLRRTHALVQLADHSQRPFCGFDIPKFHGANFLLSGEIPIDS